MTTFEDRLLDLLVDEVSQPSLPPAEDPPAPQPVRRRTRVAVTVVGIAAAVALVAGVGVVLSRDDAPVVTTAADDPPARPDVYLTIGDPTGEVQRMRVGQDQQQRHSFRRADGSGEVIDVQLVGAWPGSEGWDEAGVAGGFQLYSLNPANSGGSPMGVLAFEDPSARQWIVSPRESASTVPLAEIDALLSAATFAPDGTMSVGAPFEEFVPLDRAPVVWTITDDRAQVMAYRNTVTDVAALDGTPTTVRGRPAIDDGYTTVWRETDDLVIRVSAAWSLGGEAPQLPAAERSAIAEGLVTSDAEAYAALPPFVGGPDARVVAVAPPGGKLGMVAYVVTRADGSKNQGSIASVLEDGLAIHLPDDAIEVSLWSGDGLVPRDPQAPACATTVAVPPPGGAVVTVTIEPGCTS